MVEPLACERILLVCRSYGKCIIQIFAYLSNKKLSAIVTGDLNAIPELPEIARRWICFELQFN